MSKLISSKFIGRTIMSWKVRWAGPGQLNLLLDLLLESSHEGRNIPRGRKPKPNGLGGRTSSLLPVFGPKRVTRPAHDHEVGKQAPLLDERNSKNHTADECGQRTARLPGGRHCNYLCVLLREYF